ncbi:MAG: hypothetical protein JWL85_981 [Candidatus Saccharibacteria bacterium]|nr:hypothetical protein [Candidatus Saccharibacteria bacterium]
MKGIKLLIGASLLVPVFALGVVHAVEGQNSQSTPGSNDRQTAQVKEKESEDQQRKLTPSDLKSLDDRLQKRKGEFKIKVLAAEQTRIKQRCVGSQGNLRSLDGRIAGVETSRNKVYPGLVDRLTGVSTKLKDRGLDTAALDSEIAVLKTKIDVYKADLSAYKQAVSDVAAMDCATDPVAFKATLQTARTLQAKLKTSDKDVKAYVHNTIKPTLKVLRDQLEAKEKQQTEGNN